MTSERTRRAPEGRREGVEALEWLWDRGWDAVGNGVVLYADELSSEPLRASRVWHSPLHLTVPRDVLLPPVLILLLVEGQLEVITPRGPSSIATARSVVAVRVDPGMRLVSDGSVARIMIEFTPPLPLGQAFESDSAQVLLDGFDRVPASGALLSLVNAMLNSPTPPASRSSHFLLSALEQAATAVFVDLLQASGVDRGMQGPEAIYARAEARIKERANDVHFTVSELSRQLSVSEGYLRRLFAARGSSPSERIREARLDIARDAMAGVGLSANLREIAEIAGFPSTRSLREALKAHPPRG